MLQIKILKKYYRSFLAAVFILVLSVISTGDIDTNNWRNIPHADKIAHFILYMFLSFILFLDFGKTKHNSSLKLVFPVTIAVAYGGLIELIQILIPDRSGDLIDFMADIAGVLAGWAMYKIYKRLRG